MVFIHGGSYGWGATSDPIYDGHNLVEKYPDLVLVTVGYRTGIMGFIDFSGVPRGEDYAGSRKTMVLGEEIVMVEDLKSEQRELIEPLLHHYFNGCYSQMDYNVPQLYRIMAQIAGVLVLIAAVILILSGRVGKKKNKK